jgi:hypothetical protein
MSRQPPRNKTPDPASGAPRGRPPAAVAVLLSGVALTLHGCLLDGLPGDAADLPPAAVAAASPVQVRSLPDFADRAGAGVLVDSVEHEGKAASPAATSTAIPELTRPEAAPQAPTDASEAAAAVPSAVAVESAAASEAAAEPSAVPASAAAEASPAGSATAAPPAQHLRSLQPGAAHCIHRRTQRLPGGHGCACRLNAPPVQRDIL